MYITAQVVVRYSASAQWVKLPWSCGCSLVSRHEHSGCNHYGVSEISKEKYIFQTKYTNILLYAHIIMSKFNHKIYQVANKDGILCLHQHLNKMYWKVVCINYSKTGYVIFLYILGLYVILIDLRNILSRLWLSKTLDRLLCVF